MNTGLNNKMENRMSYHLKAKHQSFDDDEHEINIYERFFHVELLEKQDGVMYDKVLKMLVKNTYLQYLVAVFGPQFLRIGIIYLLLKLNQDQWKYEQIIVHENDLKGLIWLIKAELE